MAHPRIVAQRQAVAVNRLMAAAKKLGKQRDLQEQVKALEAINAKDPAMAQMLQTEALADLLEGAAVEPEEPPVTVETVKEEPLKTVETVEVKPAETVRGRAGVPRSRGKS